MKKFTRADLNNFQDLDEEEFYELDEDREEIERKKAFKAEIAEKARKNKPVRQEKRTVKILIDKNRQERNNED